MKNFPELKEYCDLPRSKQTHTLAMLYIQKCVEVQGKFMNTLMPIRRFFAKQDDITLHSLYDFLINTEGKRMNMTELFSLSKLYQTKQREARDAENRSKVTAYKDYTDFIEKL